MRRFAAPLGVSVFSVLCVAYLGSKLIEPGEPGVPDSVGCSISENSPGGGVFANCARPVLHELSLANRNPEPEPGMPFCGVESLPPLEAPAFSAQQLRDEMLSEVRDEITRALLLYHSSSTVPLPDKLLETGVATPGR